MSGEKKDFCILLWSGEDIKISNEDLGLIIQGEAPDTKIQLVNRGHLRQMDVGGLMSFLDSYSENSVLIISSSVEAENMDSWKLGFIMGKVSVPARNKEGKEITGIRIIGFKKEDQTRSFQELTALLPNFQSEIAIKREIKKFMKAMGIETKFDIKEFTAGKRAAGKEEI